MLSLQVASVRSAEHPGHSNLSSHTSDAQTGHPPISLWRDFREGAVHVWHTPQLLAAMLIAALVNLTAFPMSSGLLPYVAKEIYHTDQTGFGYLAASFSFGALLGSIFLSRFGHALPPARMMAGFCCVWYCMALVFAHMPGLASGVLALLLTGCAQSLGMVPMSAMLLRNADARFRGHVMGIRMLMIYSLPVGLVAAGPLITHYGLSHHGDPVLHDRPRRHRVHRTTLARAHLAAGCASE
jgi:MFS family permease